MSKGAKALCAIIIIASIGVNVWQYMKSDEQKTTLALARMAMDMCEKNSEIQDMRIDEFQRKLDARP